MKGRRRIWRENNNGKREASKSEKEKRLEETEGEEAQSERVREERNEIFEKIKGAYHHSSHL